MHPVVSRALSLIEDLFFGRPGTDPRASAGRLAGTLYIGGALVVVSTVWTLPASVDRLDLTLIAGAGLLIGLVVRLLPWEHWPDRAIWSLPIGTLAGMATAARFEPAAVGHYLAFNALVSMFVGLTRRPGAALTVAPLGLGTYLFVAGSAGQRHLAGLVIQTLVAVAIGEILALAIARHSRTGRDMAALLDAAVTLGAATTEREAAAAITSVLRDLLGADAVTLWRSPEGADPIGGPFVLEGESRAVIHLGRDLTDWAADPPEQGIRAAMATGRMIHVGDAASSRFPTVTLDGTPAASVLYLPLRNGPVIAGAVVASWRQRHRRLDAFVHRALELLAPEAGRALSRLRVTTNLARAAETDPVTGLLNRRAFDRALSGLAAGDALAIIDLDHFKAVNDRFGHAEGDVLLARFGEAIAQVVRRGDLAIRYGGEEFAIVLSAAGQHGVELVMSRLQREWRATSPLATFSAGVAVREADEDPAGVFLRADAALYEAKRGGRDRVEHARTLVLPNGAREATDVGR